MIDTLAAVSRIPYLRNLPETERQLLAKGCEIRHAREGACLFREGDDARGILLILHGRVRLVRASPEGRQQVLHEEDAGATLGEVPVFDGQGYVASAIAVGEVSVCFVPRKPLVEALARNPASASAVIQVLAARLRKFAALVEDLSTRAVHERLAGYLLRQAAAAGSSRLQLPATREQLAAHLGTVREQVSRSLSELKRLGIIAVDANRVQILDADRLQTLAGHKP